jgi:hypothetical protein
MVNGSGKERINPGPEVTGWPEIRAFSGRNKKIADRKIFS